MVNLGDPRPRPSVQETREGGPDEYGQVWSDSGYGVSLEWAESLNEAIVKAGYAWVYRKYCVADFCSGWLELEQEASDSGLGVWVDKDPVPPWDFRKKKR